MKTRILICAAATLLTAACATSGTGRAPRINERQAPAAPELQTRIHVAPACPGAGGQESLLGSAIAALILKPLLEAAVFQVGDALKKAGEDQKTQISQSRSLDFYSVEWAENDKSQSELQRAAGCYTIVIGTPAPETTTVEKAVASFRTAHGLEESLEDGTLRSILASDPDNPRGDAAAFSEDVRLVARLSVTDSDDGSAVQIKPVLLIIGKPLAPKKPFVSENRDIVLTVRMQTAGQTGTGEAFAIASIVAKDVADEKLILVEKPERLLSGWFPQPPVPASSKERIAAWDKSQSALQDQEELLTQLQAALQNIQKPGSGPSGKDADELEEEIRKAVKVRDSLRTKTEVPPFTYTSPGTVSVTVTETRDGNRFLADLGSYITANKGDIAKPFFEEFDPGSRETRSTEADDLEVKLQIAAIEAVEAHKAAQAKTGTDRSEAAIRVTEIKAQQACRKLLSNNQFEASCIGY